MRGLGFSALSNAWLLALVPPLILFYFLKLKRPRLRVPSLVLWQKVLEDERVNSPFQRFKRNLLLLLQLLLLLFLIAAGLQPFWRGRQAEAERVPVLVDCSASMGALDEPGGRTRLEVAKDNVERMIDGLLPGQEMCLISFDRAARKVTDFTDNKRILREALGKLKITDVTSDVDDALRTVQALAQAVPCDRAVMFSDGNFPEQANVDLSFELDYRRVPPGGTNVGITALNARRGAPGQWDVFCQVAGSADELTPVTVGVTRNGEEVGTEHITVSAEEGERLVFPMPAEEEADLEVRLVPDGFDALEADNVAFLHLPPMRPLPVRVAGDLPSYRHAVQALPSVELSDTAAELLVTDRADEPAAEAAVRFYVGVVPPDLQSLISVDGEGTAVVDWQRTAPLLQYVDFRDLVIVDRPVAAEGTRTGDFEELGYEVLIHGETGPLLLRRRARRGTAYYMLFHTDRSTLPYRVGFPVLVANLVEVAMREAGLAEVQPVLTGVLPDIETEAGIECRVIGPEGGRRVERSNDRGLLSGVPAPRVGRYTLDLAGERRTVGASLLSPQETGLTGLESIEFEEELTVAASEEQLRTNRPLWRHLVLVAFALMLVEWWYFQRGAGGFA